MALGDQSKALIIISKARGWDPTVIPGVGSIANFDKAPLRPGDGDHCVGSLPEGTADSYPQAEEPRYSGSLGVDWQNVDTQGPNRATKGADPNAGKGDF